jgi:dipeptidase E
MLLTSGGVTNPTIRAALVDLLGKPVSEADVLCVPTAQWGHPACGPESAHRFVAGGGPGGLTSLGWRSVGLLELTALPTVPTERWVGWVERADVLLVDGGDATYLGHWLRRSGLADLLPSLTDTLWVGVSAGSMVLTPRVGEAFVEWAEAPDDRGLGLVDFSIFPHLGVFAENTMAEAERWAAQLDAPAYVLDDDGALRVDEDGVQVVSEGEWRRLDPAPAQPPLRQPG